MKAAKLPLPQSVVIPMAMHIGAPAKPVVKVGDHVKTGQLIGEAGGFVSAPIYASISGTVKKIGDMTNSMGRSMQYVEIESDGLDERWEGLHPPKLETMQDFLDAVRASGLVGLGGAGFPTVVKLTVKNLDQIKCVIINCAECEPYVTSDTRAMLDYDFDVIGGCRLLQKFLHVPKIVFGIEENKPECIRHYQALVEEEENMEVCPLPAIYPQGGEKILIYHVLRKVVEEGKLPLDAGAIADSLGVAAPYVENELERLVRGELMGKTPGGLCYTRAFILKKSDSYGDIEAQEEMAAEILEPLAGALGRFAFPGLSGKALETLKLFSLYTLTERIRELAQDELRGEISLPERPNGGNWLAIGQIEDKSFPKYDSSGPAQTSRTSESGHGIVFDFQSAFGDTHWVYGQLPQPMSLLEARDLFLDLAEGRTPDPRLLENLPDLERLHIVKRDGASTNLDVPVMTNAEYAKFNETSSIIVKELFDEVGGKIKKLIGSRKLDVPKTVDEREAFVGYSTTRILPLAVIFAAVESGIIDAKIGESPMIVVVTG